jgi:hypothetical protein
MSTNITVPAGRPVIEYTYEREPGSNKLFAPDVGQRDLLTLDPVVRPMPPEQMVENNTSGLRLSYACSSVSGTKMEVLDGRPSAWVDTKATVSIYTFVVIVQG